MNNIRKNSLCPCMSGLKYSECCEPYEEFYRKTRIVPFHENYVLKIIFEESKKFKEFYENEKFKIKDPLIWSLDKNLNSIMKSKTILIGDTKINLIVLKEVPIKLFNSFDAVHEMMHVINSYEGFPSIKVKQNCEDNKEYQWIASIFISMLNDLIINKKMVSMGFDFKNYYQKAINIQASYIKSISSIHTRNQELYTIFVCTQRLVEWDFMVNNTECPFILVLREKLPELETDVFDLYKLINKIGFDTGGKIIELGNKIIEIYKLKFLKLIY